MKDCSEFMDLISAYADGELKDPDTFQLEEHLGECESCSALLEMYREISAAADEQSVEAPEALRIGVMNRIRNEEIFHTAGNTEKRRKPLNIILMRYAPIAACLVVMLLVWQFWGDLWGARDDAMSPAAPAPQSVMDAPAPEELPPEAAPAPAPASPEDALDVEPEPAGGFTNSLDDTNIEGDAPPDADDADGYAEDADDNDGSAEDDESDPRGGRSLPSGDRSAEETEQIMQYIDGAYAQITVTGELPALLNDYQPQPFGSWFGWEMVFEIPSDKVQVLLEELGDREDVSVTRNHDNSESTYAIVLFSPGE